MNQGIRFMLNFLIVTVVITVVQIGADWLFRSNAWLQFQIPSEGRWIGPLIFGLLSAFSGWPIKKAI